MLFLILVCVHVYIGHLYKLFLNFGVCTCVYWTPLSVVLDSGVCTCVYWTPVSVVINSGVCKCVYWKLLLVALNSGVYNMYNGHLYQFF